MTKFLRLVVTCVATLLLIGCFGSKKVQPIIQFTNLLSPEAVYRGEDIIIPERSVDLEQMQQYIIAKSEMISKPLFVEGVVYSIDKYGILTAFDINASKTLWSTSLTTTRFSKEYIGGGVVYQEGKIYATYGDVYLVELDANTGLETMRARLEDVASSTPVIIKDTVIVQTDNNQLYAFASALTQPLWKHGIYPEVITMAANVSPIIYKGNILVAYSSGHLFYLNAEDGSQIWASMIDAPKEVLPNYMPAGIHIQPLILDNIAYIATAGGELVKCDLDNGQILWRKAVSDIQSMSHYAGILYITTNARQVAALSACNGEIIWATDLIDRTKLKKLPEPTMHSAPLAINKMLLVYTSEGKEYQLDIRSGNLLAEVKAPTKIKFVDWSNDVGLSISYSNKIKLAK